jgi:hypothetical protein
MRSRLGLSVAVLAAAWVAGSSPAIAQSAAPARVEVSAAAGWFAPADEAVKAIYPGTKVPVVLLADVRMTNRFSVFAGGRLVSAAGHPVVADGGPPTDADVELSVRAVVLGVRAHYRRGVVDVSVGAGAVHSTWTESWTGSGESNSGGAWGPTAHAGVAIGVHRRLALVSRVEWSSADTGQGSVRAADVNLGGIDLLAGIAVRF